MTRSGIEYDLYKSPYKFNLEDYEFRFSSNYNLSRFKEQLLNNPFDEKIFNFFIKSGFEFYSNILSAFCLYGKIEKRGWLILKNSVKVECLHLK